MRTRYWIALLLMLAPLAAVAQNVGPGGGTGIGPGGGGGGVGCPSANNCTFTGTTSMSAVNSAGINDSVGINTSGANGYQLAGTSVLGSGIAGSVGNSAGPGFVFTTAVDLSTFSGNIRQNQIATTLTQANNTSNIWQNLFSTVAVNGPGIDNGEISALYGGIQINPGATFETGEVLESRIDQEGTTNLIGNYTALFTNYAGATTTEVIGLNGIFTNNNATAGSVGNYTFLHLSPFAGTGSKPTNMFFAQNAEPSANTSLLGKLTIGNIGVDQAITTIIGPDTSFSTWLLDLENSAAAHVILARDDGSVSTSGAWTFGSTGDFTGVVTGAAYTIANGVAPTVTTGTGAGGGGTATATGNQNSQVITVITGSGTAPAPNAVVATVSVQGIASTNGPSPTITAGNAAAAGIMADIWAASSGLGKVYTINATTALSGSTTYVFNVTSWSW